VESADQGRNIDVAFFSSHQKNAYNNGIPRVWIMPGDRFIPEERDMVSPRQGGIRLGLIGIKALVLLLGLSLQMGIAADWPQWQGPDRNAISKEKGLLQEWPAGGPKLAWKIKGIGGGDGAPAIVAGKIFGMGTRDGKETVWALSEADGKELWTTPIGDLIAQRMPQSKEGPGGTPTIDGDNLYVVGMGGKVACLSIDQGKILWEKSLTNDFGGVSPMWSFRESPLVDGNRLICTPGGKEAILVALDKKTGETLWKCPQPAAAEQPANERPNRPGGGRPGFTRSGAAYSSVIAIDLDKQRQYVQFTSTSVIAVSPTDGKLLWKYDHPANANGINCSTPIFQDGLIFASSAYGNGAGAAKLNKSADGSITPEEVYFTKDMQNHHGGMVVLDGALYGASGGNEGGMMAALDFQTGKVLWKDRKGPKGSLMLADGRIYLRSEKGEVLLIEPSKEKLIEKGRFEQPERSSSPAWAHPVVANGKLYIRDQDKMFCYDVKK